MKQNRSVVNAIDSEGTPRFRRWFSAIGAAGLLLVASAAALFGYALSQGVHCPECDQHFLGAAYPWWARFFFVKNVVLGAGVVGGLAGFAGRPRRWGAIALALAAVLTALTPM